MAAGMGLQQGPRVQGPQMHNNIVRTILFFNI